jgi:high affinity Mn2+ porin
MTDDEVCTPENHEVSTCPPVSFGDAFPSAGECGFLRIATCCILLIGFVFFCGTLAHSQDSSAPDTPAVAPETADPQTIFPHSNTARWWISGQINNILQGHPSFFAAYSGAHSLDAPGEIRDSLVLTLYTGWQLTRLTEIIFDPESTQGRGISDALGLAGFTNLDVVRNPDLGAKPYVARVMIRQIIPLSRATTEEARGPLSLATEVPARRLELRAGKLALPDFFDVNAVGSDDHLQFLNWTDVNNGGYDYAADTRGYTYAAILEYYDRAWALRFAEALMPKVANGIDLDWDLHRARAENVELESHPRVFTGRASAVRLLSYVNHGNMGDYREAVALFREGRTPVPIIEDARQQGTVKYGFGVNLEQQVTGTVRTFGRFGWNEGQHESFAYTEVNQTFTLGADYRGNRWRRKHDKVGAAFITNAISKDHQEYLRLGGLGFLLGDGNLNYGRENILETYYNAHFWRGVYGAFDLQHINNPGYNRNRGPVWVPGLRLHLEL